MHYSRSHDALIRVYDEAGNGAKRKSTLAIPKNGKYPMNPKQHQQSWWRRRTARMCALTNIVHGGNSIAIHIQFEITRRRVRPQANPENAIQRGKIPVRKAITHVEKMKTPAILTAKMFRKA